jgi:hypothetical protein
MGNPAKQIGWVNDIGEKLSEISSGIYADTQGNNYELLHEQLIKK